MRSIVSAKAFVRSGSASGGFSTVDLHQLASDKNTLAKGVGVDASGAVLLTGVATDAANTLHLFVRRSANGAANTFATIDLYQGAPGKTARGLAIAVDSSGIALVAGLAQDAANVTHAIVRRISASGAVLSDYFKLVSGNYNGIYINPVSGIAYCTGGGADGAVNSSTLVVRKL